MEYLLFLIIPLMSVTKGIGQSYVSKNNVKSFKDNCFLNLLMFAVAAILFSALYLRGAPNTTVLLYALGFGAAQVLFQISYTLAFKYGTYAITTTILGFALVIQVLICLFFFGEQLNTLNYIAFIPLAASIVLFALKGKEQNKENKNRLKWIIFTFIAFACNAGLVILPIFFKHEAETIASMSGELYAWSFIFATIMMLPIFGVSFFTTKEPLFKLEIRNISAIVVAGVTLVFYNYLSTIALNYFPGAIIYPIRNGLTIVANFLADILFYKTKITIPQWIAAGFAIVAVVLLNL